MQIRVKGQLVYLPMEKQYVKYAQQAKQLLHASVVKSGEDLVVKFSDPSVARKFAEKIADPMNIQYEGVQPLTEWTLSDVELAMRKAGLTHDVKIMVDRLRKLPNFDPSHITLNDLRKVDLATSKSGYSTQTQRELEKIHGGLKENGAKDIQKGKLEAQIKELTKLVYRLEKDMENEDDDEHYDHLEDIQSKAEYKIEMLEKQLKQLGENTVRSFIKEEVSKLLEAEDIAYVVYMRFTPKHHWSLNLVERDLERAKKLAAKWKQQQIEYGKKNGKKWDVQVAIDPVVNPSGDVAKMDNKKSLSPKAIMV